MAMAHLLISATCTTRSLSEPLLRAGRVSCFFSDRRKKEEARKVLEYALSQKKEEFEKWNEQIKKREQEREGGGGTGRGGQYGEGGWYAWFGRDKVFQEAIQVTIVIFGIGLVYLLLAKGEAKMAMVQLLSSATCTPCMTRFLPERLSSYSETLTLTQDRCSSRSVVFELVASLVSSPMISRSAFLALS